MVDEEPWDTVEELIIPFIMSGDDILLVNIIILVNFIILVNMYFRVKKFVWWIVNTLHTKEYDELCFDSNFEKKLESDMKTRKEKAIKELQRRARKKHKRH